MKPLLDGQARRHGYARGCLLLALKYRNQTVNLPDSNTRGVNGTDWIRFDRALYDACIDRTDYRARKGG